MYHDEIKKQELEKERGKLPEWTQQQFNQLLSGIKYEYYCTSLTNLSVHEITKYLNENFGKEGWELVSVTWEIDKGDVHGQKVLFFKRPIKET